MIRAAFSSEQFRFLAVGGWNTLFGYATFALLFLWLSPPVHYLAVAVIAHLIASINAWACYRWLVFKSRSPHFAEYVRFNATSLLLLALQLGALWLLSDGLGLHPLIGQAIAIVFTLVVAYFVHKRFSFKQRDTGPCQAP